MPPYLEEDIVSSNDELANEYETAYVSRGSAPTRIRDLDNEMREESQHVPIVTSDLLPTSQNNSPRIYRKREQQTPTQESKQTPAFNRTRMQPSTPSNTQFAVHIRSIPATPTTSARQTSVLVGRGRGSRITFEQPKMGSEIFSAKPSPREERAGEPSLQLKKRGRPKGWKPGMAYSEIDPNPRPKERKRPTEPGNGPGTEAKRRGRPPRPPVPSARERYLQSNPDFLPYRCEWIKKSSMSSPAVSDTCPAELQNFETLRRHVYAVHGQVKAKGLSCRWGRCASKDPSPTFADVESFQEHMEKKHFVAHLWHMGEGYNNRGIETLKSNDAQRLPDYLFDKDGKQVTPSVNEQALEDDQQYKERKRKLKRLLWEQNENAPSEEDYIKQTLGMA